MIAQGSGENGWRRAAGTGRWEAHSFLEVAFLGGSDPALCGQRTSRSQRGAAGRARQPAQELVEPPARRWGQRVPTSSQNFTVSKAGEAGGTRNSFLCSAVFLLSRCSKRETGEVSQKCLHVKFNCHFPNASCKSGTSLAVQCSVAELGC